MNKGRVFDPMENTLSQIADPNIGLETVTIQKSYLSTPKSTNKVKAKKSAVKPEVAKSSKSSSVYNDYSDATREIFIGRMFKSPEERG